MMKKKIEQANIPSLADMQEMAQLEGVELVACHMTVQMMTLLPLVLLDHYFFSQSTAQHVAFKISRNRKLPLVVIGNDFNFIICSQTHGQKPHLCAGATVNFFDYQSLARFCLY